MSLEPYVFNKPWKVCFNGTVAFVISCDGKTVPWELVEAELNATPPVAESASQIVNDAFLRALEDSNQRNSRRLEWLHSDKAKDADGWEYGVMKVKFGPHGQIIEGPFWTRSDSSDIDAVMQAIPTGNPRPVAESAGQDMVLVPREPTEEMLEAGAKEARSHLYDQLTRERTAKDVYRAMCEAVPSQDVAEAKDAARYRWLRDNSWYVPPVRGKEEIYLVLEKVSSKLDDNWQDEIDEAIDAAMAADKERT